MDTKKLMINIVYSLAGVLIIAKLNPFKNMGNS